MVFQSPSKEALSEAALKVCSSKNLLLKSYSKFIGKHPCRRIILEKVAKQTDLETVSELFCVEDSKSNHEQKEARHFKKESVMLNI